MKRTKKSQKKTKFLLILIVLTAILSITATYAWFSSQRDVEITGIKLNVEVAESMEISLDGEHWTNSITIEDMRQFYGTYGVNTAHQAKPTKIGDDAYQNLNYVPTELLPVSTVGTVTDSGEIQFMVAGTFSGKTLTATPCSETDLATAATVKAKENENDSHPYLVFDMYLKNLSSRDDITKKGTNIKINEGSPEEKTIPAYGDLLQLNESSRVWVSGSTNPSSGGTAESQEGIGKENVGLENCARVGFVTFAKTADVTADGATVRGLTAKDDSTNPQLTIWEPNDKAHITEVINNSSRGVQADTTMPTYGIIYKSPSSTIGNVETVPTEDNGYKTLLAEQKTMKPAYGADGKVNAATDFSDVAGEKVILAPNAITKVRVYLWLEGQDVDCINVASTGDRLQANIRLVKPEGGNTANTYDGNGVQNGGQEPGQGGN